MKHFKAIAAMSLMRAIGRNNKIPWHLPEDFKWFKRMTTGQIVVMGRKTFESIGRVLPDRTTIVLSRSNFQHPGVQTVADLSALQPDKETRDIFICGGAQVYREALPLCSELYLTVVKEYADGDTFFPPFEDQFVVAEEILDLPEFKITRYRNLTLTNSPQQTS